VNRRAWLVFVCCQSVAIVGLAAVRFFRSDWLGAPLLVVSFVGLLPGDYLSILLVERLFWSRMTFQQMSAVEIPITVLVNGVLWWSLARGCRYVKSVVGHRRRSRAHIG